MSACLWAVYVSQLAKTQNSSMAAGPFLFEHTTPRIVLLALLMNNNEFCEDGVEEVGSPGKAYI
jgi:hypothetical protein